MKRGPIKQRTEKCLYDKCYNQEDTRGLCIKHYNRVTILLKKGITTWKELEQKGKAKHKLYKRYQNNIHKDFIVWLDLEVTKNWYE